MSDHEDSGTLRFPDLFIFFVNFFKQSTQITWVLQGVRIVSHIKS